MKAKRQVKKAQQPNPISEEKGKVIIEQANRGIKFITEASQLYPYPSQDAMFVLECILKFAHSLEGVNGEQGIPMVAAMAVRAAWQYGRTQQMPPIRVEMDTVPMILSTIKDIPDECFDRIKEVSAAVYATLRLQAIDGEDVARRNNIRLAFWVMYTYGKRSKAKETIIEAA